MDSKPQSFQSWKRLFIRDRVQAMCEHPSWAREWRIADFGDDPRIATLVRAAG